MKLRSWIAALGLVLMAGLVSVGASPAWAQEEAAPSEAAVTAARDAVRDVTIESRNATLDSAAGIAQAAIDSLIEENPEATAEEQATAAADAAKGYVEATAPAVGDKWIFNTLLFLVGGFLVMWMAAGFTMLEAGLVRTKNVAMQCTKNVLLFSIAAIAYYLVGYNLMYPLGNWSVDLWIGAFGPGVLEDVGVAATAADDISYASTGSDFFFQLMFCGATASIVSGTLAERIKLWPFLIFVIVLTGVIYPIQASWKWGGGFLYPYGDAGDAMAAFKAGEASGVAAFFGFEFLDFAGSTVVHSVGGWAALAGALLLGSRIGKYKDGKIHPMPGSSLPLATLGTFILWLGWFGFNGGSQLALGTIGDAADVSRIFSNTNTAAAGGAIVAALLTQILYGKVDLTMVLNGALAGLVSITAEPLTPSLGEASLIGAVGGVIVVFTVPLLDRLRIDDVVGAIPVHLFAGIWGTIAVVFTNPDAEILTQLVSIGVVGVFVFVVSFILWGILKYTIGIRVSAEDEVAGLDTAEIGMEAYPEFGKQSVA